MTDKYGTDAEGHEGEIAAEAETWQDDQPPVDDFADQPSETATVSEETEVPEDHMAADVEEKKKSLLLPVAASLGGLLFLGAIVYWQFGPNSTSSVVVQTPPPLSTTKSVDTASPAPTPNGGDIADLQQPPLASDVAPTTALAPITDTKTASPAPSSTTLPAVNGVATPVATSVTNAAVPPAPTSIPAETLAKAPPVPTSAPVSVPLPPVPGALTAPTPLPTSSAPPLTRPSKGGDLDARLNNLSAHVEDLQKSLAQATQQLSQVSNMLAAGAQPAASGQASPRVEERLGKIEQQLMQLQHKKTVTSPSPVITEETPTAVVADATPEKPLSASSTYVAPRVKHKTVMHKKTSGMTHKTTASNSSTPSHWVLRAATPDEAWVSASVASVELRHVQVGDVLPGVGHVTAIRQDGDSWTVVGSKGTIH